MKLKTLIILFIIFTFLSCKDEILNSNIGLDNDNLIEIDSLNNHQEDEETDDPADEIINIQLSLEPMTSTGEIIPWGLRKVAVDPRNGNLWTLCMGSYGYPDWGRLYLYDIETNTWHRKANLSFDPLNDNDRIIVTPRGHIYIVSYNTCKLYKSANDGQSLKVVFDNSSVLIRDIVMNKYGDIYIGTHKGFYRTVDFDSWVKSNTGLGNLYINSLAIAPNGTIYAGTDGGIYRSRDDGKSWLPADYYNIQGELATQLSPGTIHSITVIDDYTILASRTNGILKSTDGGISWTMVSDIRSKDIFYNSNDGYLLSGYISDSDIAVSTDMGNSWEVNNFGSFKYFYNFGFDVNRNKVYTLFDGNLYWLNNN